MSASNAAAEPSMEEILSSIRQAINEDIPGAVPENTGDPFASGSSAEAAFSSPPPGQAFDAAVHESHDPFAELTRKLNETRESVQKQMHGVSSTLKTEASSEAAEAPVQAPEQPPVVAEKPATPPEPMFSPPPNPQVGLDQPIQPPHQEPATEPTNVAPAPPSPEPEPARAASFSAAPAEMAPPEEPANTLAAAGTLQALTARVAEEQKTEQVPVFGSQPETVAQAQAEETPAALPQSSDDADGAGKSQVPELSWASAELSAAIQSSPIEEPSAPDPVVQPPEPAVAPNADRDPFPKLTAIMERGAVESKGSEKTDQAMTDLVLRRILEPAVRAWLDDNLPKIVTEVVREEVRRVANQAE